MNSPIQKIALKNKKSYLSSIFKVIPTNTYINKFLPNTRATTLELESRRHSIIIEPNVPVIIGKEDLYNKNVLLVRGAYENVKFNDIIDYLNSDVPFKKIITTPESYPKVRSAINNTSFNLYKDFFILLDECEKIIQDCVYRKKIILPFDDFFKYTNKAMISATPLMPSDPRFKKFKHIQVVPKFNYKKSLSLVTTNSILISLRKYIEQTPDKHYFIFLNSTQVIASLIKALDIKDESAVYCSRESVIELKINDIPDCSERLPKIEGKNGPFKKFNFFTSRFFSAVDIMLPYKPTVIMLTEVNFAFHSILDPTTEAVQILGRFRNGFKKAVHITNIDQIRKPKTVCVSKAYLEGCEASYIELKMLHKAATSEGGKATLKEALERVEYAQFIYEDGSKNYFMWDNYVNEERVKAYYSSKERLITAYKYCKHFRVQHSPEQYPYIDLLLNPLAKEISEKKTWEKVCEALQEVFDNSTSYTLENIEYFYKQIDRSFPEILEAFRTLGHSKIFELGYNKYKIRKEIYELKSEEEKGNIQLLNKLKLEFAEGSGYPSQIIIRVLRMIINELNLSLKPSINLLREFFDLGPRTTLERSSHRKDVKGYKILKMKFS